MSEHTAGTGTGKGKGKSKEKASKSNGVTSNTFLSLKADLAQLRNKGSGSVGTARSRKDDLDKGVGDGSSGSSMLDKRSNKKLPVHLQPSPGVLARSYAAGEGLIEGSPASTTTSSWASTPLAQLELARSRAALERKAEMYDKLKKGLHAGLDGERRKELVGLVDWERKLEEHESSSGSDSDSEEDGDGGGGGKLSLQDDPIIEYVDDFGRTRSDRRSNVPLHLLPPEHGVGADGADRSASYQPPDEALIYHGPSIAFPVYQRPPTGPGAAGSRGDHQSREGEAPRIDRFDGSHEVRNRGAGFYQFATTDELERRRQMEALAQERQETISERAKRGREAEGSPTQEEPLPSGGPGQAREQDGPPADPFARVEAASAAARPPETAVVAAPKPMSAAQKRLAERRAEVEAKRRKVLGPEAYEKQKKEQEEKRIIAFLDGIVKQGD